MLMPSIPRTNLRAIASRRTEQTFVDLEVAIGEAAEDHFLEGLGLMKRLAGC